LYERGRFGSYLGASQKPGKVKLKEGGDAELAKETRAAMEMLEQLRFFEARAEEAYERMDETKAGSELTARYSDAKEFFHEAIALARRLGLRRQTKRLSEPLEEIKPIFARQFPG